MSEAKVRKPREKKVKLAAVPENGTLVEMPPKEKKPRASRAKKQPTREEAIDMLEEATRELNELINGLLEDEAKLVGMSLKKVPDLIKDSISDFQEDMAEIKDELEHLKSVTE